MAPGNRPAGFVTANNDTLFVFWDCLCEAASPDDCDCPNASWFQRAETRHERTTRT